jgi:TolB protein
MIATFSGDAPRPVAASPHRDQMPEWSADGRLLFLSNRRGAGNDLFITGFDGAAPELVAENVHLHRVSPDGTRILFTRTVAGHADVYVMGLNGSGVTRLTSGSFYESEAEWSPDGSRIAFVAQPDLNYDIYLMDADGSNRMRVTRSADRVPIPTGGWDATPRWSPDGKRLIFETRVTVGWWDVLVLDLGTGAEVRLIAEDRVANQNPVWVP